MEASGGSLILLGVTVVGARWRQSDPVGEEPVVEARWRQSDPLERNSSGSQMEAV